jgi:hypothetical protein
MRKLNKDLPTKPGWMIGRSIWQERAAQRQQNKKYRSRKGQLRASFTDKTPTPYKIYTRKFGVTAYIFRIPVRMLFMHVNAVYCTTFGETTSEKKRHRPKSVNSPFHDPTPKLTRPMHQDPLSLETGTYGRHELSNMSK